MAASTKIKVKQGTVVGGQRTLPNGRTYDFYQGIPYAKPPVGELRFKAPVPLERFAATEIDCTKEGSVSLQKNGRSEIIGSEDCLFLNVYTPKTVSNELLPVMVYIHGGAFMFDSGNSSFYNPLYLLQEEVVVVTLNYRLGVLGFLSLPEANIYGNAALKDQRLALHWVKDNISKFNGDPNNVTLFGESVGSVCTHLHLLSENSKNLFHKVILQSGLGNVPWAIETNASHKTKTLAHQLGCTSDDSLEIAKFLQSFDDPHEFVKSTFDPVKIEYALYGRPVPIRPVIEKENPEAVITQAPLEMMKNDNTVSIPVMMGFNSAEGCQFLPLVIKDLKDINKQLRKFIPKSIDMNAQDPRSLELAKAINEFYFNGAKPTATGVCDIITDFFYASPLTEAAEIHSSKHHKSPLYFYRFDYDGPLNFYKNKVYRMQAIKGASHGDELCYLFQAAVAPEPWETETKKIVQTMCKLWTNFAKYSNPTPDKGDGLLNCTWDPVRKTIHNEKFSLNTFVINVPQEIVYNPNQERIAFWRNIKNTFENGKTISKL